MSLTENIKFTVVGPVITDHPVCRPGSAAVRHSINVGDEKGSSVVRLLGLDADALERISNPNIGVGITSAHDLRGWLSWRVV